MLSSTRTGTWSRLVGLALVSLAITGCEDSVIAPEETGAVQTFVADDPAAPPPAPSFARLDGSSARSVAAARGEYSGSLDARVQSAVSADGETWIELGPPRSVSVGLQAGGDGADVHGEAEIPAGTYSHVRLVLEDATANVAAGSSIGALLLTAGVSIRLGTQARVVIEKTIPPFEVHAGTRASIRWDMNSHVWMSEERAEEEEVEEDEVEEAAEAETETTSREEI